jgi:lipoyl(octanoyl) transferase
MAVHDRTSEELWVCDLGTIPYREALAIQARLSSARQADELPDMLLLLEHPPVYTCGRRSGAEDLPFEEDFYRAKGIDVVATDRGGRLTYHAPGQLVGYPIMRIDDVHRFLRTIEDALIAALAGAGVSARSRHAEGIDYTGVWVAERKIASIGLHVARGVTTHGFAVNVENDVEPFSWVIACGLPELSTTSLALESRGGCESLKCFRRRVAHSFANAHGRRQRLVSPHRLGIHTARPAGRATERAPIEILSTTAAAVPAYQVAKHAHPIAEHTPVGGAAG